MADSASVTPGSRSSGVMPRAVAVCPQSWIAAPAAISSAIRGAFGFGPPRFASFTGSIAAGQCTTIATETYGSGTPASACMFRKRAALSRLRLTASPSLASEMSNATLKCASAGSTAPATGAVLPKEGTRGPATKSSGPASAGKARQKAAAARTAMRMGSLLEGASMVGDVFVHVGRDEIIVVTVSLAKAVVEPLAVRLAGCNEDLRFELRFEECVRRAGIDEDRRAALALLHEFGGIVLFPRD